MLRPGVREHEVVAMAMQRLFELGSEQVEAINAVSGDRCNPHPHVFSDRLLRPGDQAFFDVIHSFMGYRTCYYRTFNVGGVTQSQLDAYKQCREWLDSAIELVRPGVTTDRIAAVWPTAEELGFPDEQACFGLQFGHGLGVSLYEAPMISRVHSLEHPITIEPGMVFALETYCAAERRPLRRAHRGGGRRHRGRQPHHHEVPRRGAARVRQDLRARSRPRARERGGGLMEAATDRSRGSDRRRRRADARALPPHAADPALRGGRPVALPEGRGARHDAPLQRRGGLGDRRRQRRSAGRSRGRHLPRPRPRARGRHLAAGPARRAARALDRRLRRPRRLDERDRPRARPDRLLRHRRRLDLGRARRLAGAARARATWRSRTSATARPTRPISTSASTSRASSRCPPCSCARTTSTASSRRWSRSPPAQIRARAEALDIAYESVDGMDVWETRAAALRATERARAGRGPVFLEMLTYRFVGHSRSDPGRYRKPGELERWQERDPLVARPAPPDRRLRPGRRDGGRDRRRDRAAR